MLAPATGFYASKGLGLDQARIAYVLNNKDMSRAFDCLQAALEQYRRKPLNPRKAVLFLKNELAHFPGSHYHVNRHFYLVKRRLHCGKTGK